MNIAEQKKAAKEFLSRWRGRGDEKQDCQSFWTDLVVNVLGVRYASESIRFEKTVDLGKDASGRSHTGFIDAYIPDTKVLIEQKGAKIDLRKPALQSDGSELTPYQQAKRYADRMTNDMRPRWIIISNFQEIIVYDLNASLDVPQVEMKLEDLENEAYRLEFIVDKEKVLAAHQLKVSLEAGALVGKLYDALEKQYDQPMSQVAYQSLNKLCVRLVFCLYAEDSGLFGTKTQFHDYLANRGKAGVGRINTALRDLFRILNTKPEERDQYEDEELALFPYVNGGLFADSHILIPPFTQDAYDTLVNRASEGFDWSEISPTIFGSVFESTLNAETRRQGGMHYTSVENIHKVIDPLFLNDLKADFETLKKSVRGGVITPKKRAEFQHFQEKLGRLKFLDPACGSGNFLTETYLSLRKLENDVIRFIYGGQQSFSEVSPIQVHINQFYGIEINDFAVAVAQAALWIAESQMMNATREIVQIDDDFLPLKSAAHIVEGNALLINWKDVIPCKELNYIMGNPPFNGAMTMKNKRADIETAFPECQKIGEVDYVSGWYVKASKYIENTDIKCSFVSTNSICQGQSVSLLWKFLIEQQNIKIDFAYRTFIWNNENVGDKIAKVHCIIVGFSKNNTNTNKLIFNEDGTKISASHINPYLIDLPDFFVEARSTPLSSISPMHMGVMARDGTNLIMSEEEFLDYSKNEPQGVKFVKRYMMGRELIRGIKRYCFWLKDAEASEIRKCPILLTKIEAVRQYRLSSPAKETRAFAETPYLFCQLAQPTDNFIAFPKVSSSNRQYIPIDFLSKDIIVGDKVYVVEKVSEYEFGILASSIHNAWMRVVAGRLKSDYSYSNTIVYNNFIWPITTEEQKANIAATAKEIFNARDNHPNSSLADLYDELTMPADLRKAHKANDRAVMKAYGFKSSMTESEIVAELFKLYQKKVDELAEAEAAQKAAKKPRKRKTAATPPTEQA